MNMVDLNDLIFDPNTGEFSVDPCMSFEELESMILNDDDSKDGYMEPIPKFDDWEDCIMQDGEFIKENKMDV